MPELSSPARATCGRLVLLHLSSTVLHRKAIGERSKFASILLVSSKAPQIDSSLKQKKRDGDFAKIVSEEAYPKPC